MKNKIILTAVGIFSLIALSGCGAGFTPVPKDTPKIKTGNEDIFVSLKPSGWGWCAPYKNALGFDFKNSYRSYNLGIKNLSDKPIEIDWNKSSYTINNSSVSKFSLNGTKYNNMGNIQQAPTVVFPKDVSIIDLTPNNSVYFVGGQYSGWNHVCINSSVVENQSYGINLVYKKDGKDYYLKIKKD